MTAKSQSMTVPAEVDRPATPAPDRRANAAAAKMRRHCIRLQAVQAIVRLLADPSARDLVAPLRTAETDSAALPSCAPALDALATIPRRRILANPASTLPPAGEAGAR